MTSRRVRQLAKELEIPARELLDRIKRDLPRIPVDSIMSYVTDEDLPHVIGALATLEPRYDLARTPHGAAADLARKRYDETRARQARAEAQKKKEAEARAAAERDRPPDFRDFRLPPARRWSAFEAILRELDTIARSPARLPSEEELFVHGDAFIKRVIPPVPWDATMARRRLATAEIGSTCRKFSWEMLEDVLLLEVDARTHAGLRDADIATIERASDGCGRFFYPIDVDWEYAQRYILNYMKDEPLPAPRAITRAQLRAELRTEDKLDEELRTAVEFEEISAEQFARITPWLAGEGEVDYAWLRTLLDDDYLTYSAALSFEQRRADEVMIAHTIDHVFGSEHDTARAIQLNDENENTRYRFMLYAGEGGVASAIFSFEL